MQKKLFLIANPKSGRGYIKTRLLSITEIFNRNGYLVTTYITSARGDATEVAAKITPDYDLVVCCGGDGTLNEVITGLMKNPKPFPLGYIPLGTLNEWSTSLGISKDVKEAAEDILTGRRIALDIGRFDNKYFVYTASFGAFTSASYSAPQDVKNALGQAAYFFEGIKSLSQIKPIPLEITIDGKEISGKFLFGSVSNSLSMGGIIKLDKELVKFDDGLFEVLLIENIDSLAELNEIIEAIQKRSFDKQRIRLYTGKEISVRTLLPLDWTLDGEHATSQNEARIANIPRAIEFIIPKK